MNAYAAVVAGIFCFLSCATTVRAQKNNAPPRPDLSQPDKAVHAFVHGMNTADANWLIACVAGAKPSEFSASLFKETKGGVPKFFTTIRKVNTKGDDAHVDFSLRFVLVPPPPGKANYPPPVKETVSLRRQNGNWLLLPLDRAAFRPGQHGYVSEVSTLLAYPDIFLALRAKAQADASLANIKVISFALLAFAASHDDTFAFGRKDYKKNLAPLLKDDKIWTSPLDKGNKQSYFFNRSLFGVSLSKIKKPNEIVLLYEGDWGKPRLRYDGKAIIAFVDGHCKLLSPDEVKKLRWDP